MSERALLSRLSGPGSAAPAGSESSATVEGGCLQVNPERIVRTYPGPALLLGESLGVLDSNAQARPITAALEADDQDGEAVQGMRTKLRLAIEVGEPTLLRLALPREGDTTAGPRSFDLIALPAEGAATPRSNERRRILVLGAETSLERNLTRALVASRELFRDLVACSSDFAWETDSGGAFIYVSPKGAAGYTAHALNGRRAQNLILRSRGAGASDQDDNPFMTSAPIDGVEVWLRGAAGQRHCMVVSAVPLVDETGRWRGARGVCREVTELRLREAEVARAQERERLVSAVVDAMRREIESDEILAATAEATAHATMADMCWVLTADERGDFRAERRHWVNRRVEGATLGEGEEQAALEEGVAGLERAGDGDLVEITCGGVQGLALATVYRGKRNGALVLFRAAPEGASAWPQATRYLIASIGVQAGIAIAQARNIRELKSLSRTDNLTGLLNRRAFVEEVRARVAEAGHGKAIGSVLYIDFDHFKQVNDTLGHGAGDALLKTFAGHLGTRIRPGDLASRLGGDEFCVWLDGASRTGAVAKAKVICALADILKRDLGAPPSFSISIGIAEMEPDGSESVEAVIARADAGLLKAKEAGRDGWVVAENAA